MTPEQALQILSELTAAAAFSLATHARGRGAVRVLQEFIKEKKEEKDEVKI